MTKFTPSICTSGYASWVLTFFSPIKFKIYWALDQRLSYWKFGIWTKAPSSKNDMADKSPFMNFATWTKAPSWIYPLHVCFRVCEKQLNGPIPYSVHMNSKAHKEEVEVQASYNWHHGQPHVRRYTDLDSYICYITVNYMPCNIPSVLLNNRLAISISGPISYITVGPGLKVLICIGSAFLQFDWLTVCIGISCNCLL